MPIDKKRMRFKVNARITSKVREKDLLTKAEVLKENFELILPKCSESCRACPFVRTRLQLERIARFKDSPDKLAKFARKGDKIARAYAATIGLAHDKKAPYLASAKYPKGTVMFALRGKTPREKLIGVQNYDSPQWRVLSVMDLVKRGKLHIYSFGDDFICTGRQPKPPAEYMQFAARAVGAQEKADGVFECPHNPDSTDHVRYDWIGSEAAVLLCDQCAIKARNVLGKLADGIAVPNVLDSIDVSIVRPLHPVSSDDSCGDLLDRPLEQDLLDEYSSGRIGDKELIEKHMDEVHEALKTMSEKVLVIGSKCFGSDVEAFVKAMTSDPIEAKALKGLLSNIGHPIVVASGDTVNKLLSTFWVDHGKASLRGVVSEELADKYFDDSDEAIRSPLKVIRRAAKRAERDAVSSQIPRYDGLSTYGKFVDGVARAFKTGGAPSASTAMDVDSSADHRTRSIAYAFDLSLGVTAREWKFTKEEKEFGKHLKKYASRLLNSTDPDAHHEAFVAFLREAGVTEEVTRI
ncbi:MAG: hypothetical protein JSV94_03825 [Methanobacteriota archaeon]|nr:MAG: hypothetical protein JSV94_03825 [Euryarchaeota archaeon]